MKYDYYYRLIAGIRTASFRGRPLKGKDVQLPSGYKGIPRFLVWDAGRTK